MFNKNFSIKKKYLFFFFIIFFVCFYFYFKKEYNIYSNSKLIDNNLKAIKSNKVIVIGDSRFSRIVKERKNYYISSNFFFIAESAKDIKWFKKEALAKLYKILDSNKYLYHVIINMGVNDIQFSRPFDDDIKSYKKEFKKLVKKYPNVKFYYLSINPIDEDKMNIFYPENRRTNNEIIFFNKEMYNFTNKNDIKYCSSFDEIVFNTVDGIHYDELTNQRIIDYINDDCIEYDLLGSRRNHES